MYFNYYIYLMMFIFSLMMLSYLYNFILLTLLSIEFIMISTLMMLIYMNFINMSMFITMYYLVYVVCEGVMGLTILILLIRNNGNDNMKFLNLIKW